MLGIHHLTLQQGNKILCKNLNFDLQPGTCWALLGPNGCGKTTLLHSLAGLFKPQAGHITLHHQSITHLSRREMAKQIGVLFQEIQTKFPQTVLEYCLAARFPHVGHFKWGSAQDKQIAQAALEQMDLVGLQEKRTDQLSGGEKKRLAIAAIITQTPTIFLLDEPTNHLDLPHQQKVLRYFHRAAKERQASILIALHDINLAQQFCDHVLMLFPNGETLAGATTQVLTRDNLSRLYQYPLTAICNQGMTYWHTDCGLQTKFGITNKR